MARRLLAVSFVLAFALAALLVPSAASAAFGPLASFGNSGTGPGQLTNPGSLAVAPDGSIYVADYDNNRIDVYGPSGVFKFAFGANVDPAAGDVCTTASGCQSGESTGAAGAMDQPESLAFDAEGRVFVADQINRRIDVFDAEGAFLYAFGKGVDPLGGDLCTAATECQPGAESSEGGGLRRPDGLGISGSTLYVADNYNNRIAVYDTNGTFRYVFGTDVNLNGEDVCESGESCQGGLDGSGAGEIGGPYDVKVDPSGSIAVTETENDRVAFFTAEGAFVSAIGKGVNAETSGDDCSVASGCVAGNPDGSAGSMNGPTALSIDNEGDVFVADTRNNRIDEWAPDGSFVKAWGAGVVDGSEAFQVCNAETGCVTGLEQDFPGAVPNPYGVAVDCQGDIWTAEAAPGDSRVQRFGEASTPNPPCQPPETSGETTSGPMLAPPVTSSASPSNAIRFGKLKLNKKNGTATLTITVSSPGSVVLSGAGVKKLTKAAKRAGSVALTVRLTGKAEGKLTKTGKAKVKSKVTFTPTGGIAATKMKTLTLKKTLG